MSTWGGSFVGTLPDRAAGKFAFGEWERIFPAGLLDSATPADLAVNALERAVDLQPTKTAWRGELADALAAVGNMEAALATYEVALKEASTSTERWVLHTKQRWQFQYERCYHQLGHGRVEDPLFDAVIYSPATIAAGTRPIAGLFNAEFTYAGLMISGVLGSAECEHVNIYVNGRLVRAEGVARDRFIPRFKLTIKRKTLALFPTHAVLEVRTPSGEQLVGPRGADHLTITVPHGNGQLLSIIGDGGTLNKKGEIRPSLTELNRREDRDLQTYARLRDFFEDRFNRPLFLLYGTLLGYHRDGDLIPGDDDFDVGYVSDETDPIAVKEEAKEIILKLVRAGFTVSVNRRGRMFRVQLEPTERDGSHVDVHPVWFQDGKVWVHNAVAIPSSRADFLPVAEGTLRGTPVSIPRRPEFFLLGNYGPGWKVPDPGFRHQTSDPIVMRNLAKALLTVGELRSLAERIKRELGDSPRVGQLIAYGFQDLYPLRESVE